MIPRWKLILSGVVVLAVIALVLSAGSSPTARDTIKSTWTNFRASDKIGGGHTSPTHHDVIDSTDEEFEVSEDFLDEYSDPDAPPAHDASELDALLHPHQTHEATEDVHKDCDMKFISGSIPEPDTFVNFRKAPGCDFKTSDLHYNFEPKCKDRKSLLEAMNSGGRHGLEAPYAARGCDFKWFNPQEVCEIMGRFDRLYFIGDSLMRQLVVAMHTIIRMDLVEGGRQSWRDDNPPEMDCRCRVLFARGSKCFWWEAIDTDMIMQSYPESIPCNNTIGKIALQARLAWPLPDDTWRDSIHGLTEKHKDGMKEVYILGHGTWNAYDLNATHSWIGDFEEHWRDAVPWYFTSPRLYISPSALSENKPARFLEKGNNIVVQQFVHAVQPFLDAHGYEHLAPYNMTVQSMSADGTHANLEASLIEAMFVLNWLSML